MSCAIPGCKFPRKKPRIPDGISLFSLPQDPEIRKIWLKAAHRDETDLPECIRICSRHFEEKYKVVHNFKKTLTSGAIPTLMLYEETEDPSETVQKIIEISTESNNMLCINPYEVLMANSYSGDEETDPNLTVVEEENLPNANCDVSTNNKDDDYDAKIAMIEKAIENIMEQLNIIVCNDIDFKRADRLKTNITKALVHYQSLLSRKYSNNSYDINFVLKSVMKTQKVKSDPDNDCADLIADILATGDIDGATDDLPSPFNNFDDQQSDSDTSSGEDSDSSIYSLYPLAKTVLELVAKGTLIDEYKTNERSEIQAVKTKPVPQYTREEIKKVVRHTCPKCDVSLASAYLLSKHPFFCKGRFSTDKNLSFWAKKECPKCKEKFSNRGNLRRHLIIHKLRDYKSKKRNDSQIAKDVDGGCDVNNSNSNTTLYMDCNESRNATEEMGRVTDEKNSSNENGTVLHDTQLNDQAMSDVVIPAQDDDDSLNVNFNFCGLKYGAHNSSESNVEAKDMKCIICEEICASKDELVKHNLKKHPDGLKPFICNHCPKAFKSVTTLRVHVESYHPEVNMAGGKNKYLSKKRGNSNSFMKNIPYKLYACSQCSEIFVTVTELTAHKRICGKKSLTNRTKQYRGPKIKLQRINNQYVCQFCSKTYKSPIGIKMHILNHTKVLAYACPKCPRKFKDSMYLKYHLNNIHDKTSFFICEICGAKYSNKNYLKRHLLVHENVRRFKCDYCQKAFHTKSVLQSHIRIHTQEKPWTCQYCDQGFSERRSWRIHMNEHEGLKPYECTLCEEAFVSRRKLNKHVQDCHNY